MTPHLVLIVVHTVAGLVAFALGCLVVRPAPPRKDTDSLFSGYQGALLVMAASLVAVVAIDWPDLSGATRATYTGLTLLGGYMLWRAWHAGSVRAARPAGWGRTYVDDIGFTLISLFEGFVIVAAIDLGAPAWVVGALAVAGVALGRQALGHVKRTELP